MCITKSIFTKVQKQTLVLCVPFADAYKYTGDDDDGLYDCTIVMEEFVYFIKILSQKCS